MSGSRVRIQIPKHRRNSGEVRPYDEVPSSKSDAILLWGTTFLLSGCVLVFGGLLFYKNSSTAVPQPEVIQAGSTDPKDLLAQSRRDFIEGQFSVAVSQARVGLALEQQQPSQPSLEKDLRRVLGLADLETQDFGEALEQFRWLKAHGPSADDLANLQRAERRYREVTADALQELEGAQRLSVSGVQDKAYVKARQAVSRLQQTRGQKSQLQAGHLVMASIALRKDDYREAREELREAKKLGPLTLQQEQVLRALDAAVAQQSPAIASAQIPVVVPRLETGAAYPKGRPSSKPIARTRPGPAAPVQEAPAEEIPQTASASQPTRKAPHLELPKLQFPSSNAPAPGGLPGYQNNNSSNSLPGYNSQTRSRDTLPGY